MSTTPRVDANSNADHHKGFSSAADVSSAYFDAAVRRVHLPDAVLLYGYREVVQVLNDPSRFTRPVPRIDMSPESLRTLSRWAVFRHDIAQHQLRTLLSTCLKHGLSAGVYEHLDAQVRRIVIAGVGAAPMEVCTEVADALTRTLVASLHGLADKQVRDLHAASELIDLTADRACRTAEIDNAISLFGHAAVESKLLDIAMRTAREMNMSLERSVIVDNIGMLLYGMFGPLPAALTNIVLAMSIHEGWHTSEDGSTSEGRLHESLRLYSPTAAIDRLAIDDLNIHGTSVRRGQIVRCVVAAANRDKAIFPDPSAFDAGRPNAKSHLAFGRGIHSCIALPLFEHIGVALINQLVAHTKQILLLSKPIEWRGAINATGPKELLVRLVSRSDQGVTPCRPGY